MKKFTGMRPLNEVTKAMAAKGFIVDAKSYAKGGDFVFFDGNIKADGIDTPVTIGIGVFGHFYVKSLITGKIIASEYSQNLDDKPWYSELLDVVFVNE